MPLTESTGFGRPPSRGASIALSVALVVVWGTIRLVVFPTTIFPLTYVIPLLIGVYTRDRLALWGMAVIFAVLHTVKLVWLLPAGSVTPDEWWANYTATLLNIVVGGAAVHLIVQLRDRLDTAMNHVRDQADELREQTEELAQQNEELAVQAEELSRQTEELTQQGEELARQNEELQSQGDEIRELNASLARREALLQTLLETARLSGTEGTALQHIANAAFDLLRAIPGFVAVYESAGPGVPLQSLASAPAPIAIGTTGISDDFVRLALGQNRTAAVDDLSLRPDMTVAAVTDHPPFRAVMCTPIRLAGVPSAALAVYSTSAHQWTEEEFRLVEWLADQCGRVLQALRVQSDLREADRRKSEFLATLSHELRNPLAPIGFALRLLEAGNTDGDHLSIIKRQVQQLVRLVDDLLDATRLTSNRIQIRRVRADLVPVVRHALDAARMDIESAGHTLDARLPDCPVWLDLDADRMAQVVSNLLNNATRYTPPGGTVTVALSVDGRDGILSVADTGVGLEAANRERIFEMFTQVGGPGSGGLGIGLALVRGIVELHGGRIEAFSDGPGHGSEFRLVLPIQDAPPPLGDSVKVERETRGGAYRVLVVDDNRDSAEMMSELLSMHGHIVRMAHDAETALAAAREFAPQTALLDIGLPGLDGYELARRLRRDHRTRSIRLVAVTGWGQDADRARAHDAGFDAHLTKPAEPDHILAALGATERV